MHVHLPRYLDDANSDAGCRNQDFTGATIYWSPLTGAHPVGGAIRDKWAQTGWEGGALGYPTEDELWVGPGGTGRMNRFERGVIYWSPTTGAHPVVGAVLSQWAGAGYEQSSYGYPTADHVQSGNALEQQFQNGRIYTPGIAVPFAPGLSLTYGVSSSTQLQPSPLPDGLVYHGAGFDLSFRATPSRNTGHIALTLTGAQAPQQFKILVGLPGGYSLQHSEYEVRMLNSTGFVVAAIGDPVAANASQQGVPVQTSVSGNQITYQISANSAYPVSAVSNISSNINPYTRIGKETSKVCAASPYDCTRAIPAYFNATTFSENNFPQFIDMNGAYMGTNDQIDADRHCLWQAMTTEAANAGFAKEMGDAHETDKPNGYGPGVMDLYNNITGRAVGLQNEGDLTNIIETCNTYAEDAVLVTDISTVNQSNPTANDLIRLG
ncbi:hypothetical protein O4215_20100 [Rhodococcus maanshanensis]|uniref:LGFP repeat-containing protein n=1 Tax=Rhodococcus maanshanensis TaxID=183556 RepID=UPI0022B56637|nr:hypothetical protein [Rhodococcus maanshanensis]MCZ4557870.1 hypothetical protein [Rhodococcus maanshanensis]